jgi:hypothetical protein
MKLKHFTLLGVGYVVGYIGIRCYVSSSLEWEALWVCGGGVVRDWVLCMLVVGCPWLCVPWKGEGGGVGYNLYSWRWAYRCSKHVELIYENKLHWFHQVGSSRHCYKNIAYFFQLQQKLDKKSTLQLLTGYVINLLQYLSKTRSLWTSNHVHKTIRQT